MARDPKRLATRRERRAQARLDAPPPRARRTSRRPERPAWQSPVVLVTGAAILIGIAIIAFARPPASSTGDTLIEPPTTYTADYSTAVAALPDMTALGPSSILTRFGVSESEVEALVKAGIVGQ